MADASLGVFGVVSALVGSGAAGFVFGEAALFAVEPTLTEDGLLLNAATLAAGRAGSTGVAVVTACLVFTSVLLCLGSGFLLAAMVMTLLSKVGVRLPWLAEATTGASVVVGAVTTGLLAGVLPPWIYIVLQGALVLFVYSYSNINDMTTALLIIFTTLYLSVVYGQLGTFFGLISMILTIVVLFVLRRLLTGRVPRRPKSKTGCKLLERIFFYSVFVGILGFFVGLGAGEAVDGSKEEVVVMLQSVLWVAYLSAALLGAGLGTVAMVGLGPEVAGKVALGVAIMTSVALRAILQWSSSLGARGSTAGTLGAATAAGVSLGAASVAARRAFDSRNSTLAVLGSVVVGAVVAAECQLLKASPFTASELITITLVAAGAFVLGAPKSPFHTQVNLQKGLLTGTVLIKEIGMETVTAAAAPIGAGALGAAALGTAALGKLGTVGVLAAIVLALGSALSGMIGKSPPTTNAHRD
ncbi:DNA polymerase iota [Sarotherodon galilaeus]